MWNTAAIIFGIFWILVWAALLVCCRWAWVTERHPDVKPVQGWAGLGLIVSVAWVAAFSIGRHL